MYVCSIVQRKQTADIKNLLKHLMTIDKIYEKLGQFMSIYT